jgi:pSer/pThr/pTyr-binding forkhead associated (FHA) protein
MSAAMALPRTGFKFMLTVRDGPDTGATYQLLPPTVTIGRGPENNVSLNDLRVSRAAAVISFTMEQITITDVSNRQSMMINQVQQSESPLKDGDLIFIGETELLFKVEALPLHGLPQTTISGAASGAVPGALPGFAVPAGMTISPNPGVPKPPQATDTQARNKKIRFYAIVVILVGGFVWFMNSQDIKPTKAKGLKTVQEIETDLKETEQRQDAIVKKREFKSDMEQTRYEEAQHHFIQGFRDYQNGQWGRAMRSFETARAIDPHHELAGRYYQLAEKHRDDMVSELTVEGRRYREKSMYARCSAALEKALDAIPNKQDVKYKATEAIKKECDLLSEDRYR